jgi:hypothetical protein
MSPVDVWTVLFVGFISVTLVFRWWSKARSLNEPY